jgi:hypothetical protein
MRIFGACPALHYFNVSAMETGVNQLINGDRIDVLRACYKGGEYESRPLIALIQREPQSPRGFDNPARKRGIYRPRALSCRMCWGRS